jgi:hypothetical protein
MAEPGWAAGLRHFVDSRYRLSANGSFDSALRAAVTNLRKTNLPVGITVQHGNHAWILTGFTATADPATTSHFTVTSVRVVGPLWGLQSTTYGYDMRPDRMLTTSQFRGFFTPWHYARVRMAWEGDWVSIQPVATTAGPVPKPTKAAAPTARPTPKPTAAAPATPVSTATPFATASPATSPSLTPKPTIAAIAELVAPVETAAPSPPIENSSPATLTRGVLLVVVALAVIGGLALGRRTRR